MVKLGNRNDLKMFDPLKMISGWYMVKATFLLCDHFSVNVHTHSVNK